MTPPSSRKRRVLIGEDMAELAGLMADAVAAAGYHVKVASDGEECLRLAQAWMPDLITLDIMMPRMHGIEVLRALRADIRTHHIAVIMCSGKDFKTERDESERFGVVEYLTKPISPARLAERVKHHFDRCDGTVPPIAPIVPVVRPDNAEVYRQTLNTQRPHFHLWGTRGSTPTLGGRFQRSGGNTSCLSVTIGDEIFVFDAGTGIRDLGLMLVAGTLRKVHLFITHPHWDHIQGFPFFAPAYVPGFDITVYGAKGFGKDLESIFRGQLDRDYFPVQLDDMKSNLHFRHLTEGGLDLAGARITWEFAQHPGATVGYKIEVGAHKIAWLPDNEFLQGYVGPPTLADDHPLALTYQRMIAFLSDVTVLIHEAQYTPSEYPAKIGWGHSSVANACLLMKLAHVPRWIVTHHDPMHDDTFLETKLNLTRQILAEIGQPTHVSHGYDGMTEFL